MAFQRRLRTGLAALLAVSGLTGVFATASNASSGLVDVMTTIPMSDGIALAAETVTAAGQGPHPLVVMPGSWGANQLEYHSIALLFGNAGYDVVGFSDRGMNQSGGVSDYADPASISDVSSVIDWAIQHLDADANAVGAFGISYGAGVGLLAAEQDPRLKAVAALSTWTDFNDTFLPSGSISQDLIRSLALSTTGSAPHVRLGGPISTLFAQYLTNPPAARKLIRQLATTRSPILGVAALNANHTAVMLANGMQDSLLPPRQLVTMFAQLKGPKKLELRTGDHGQPEAEALYGGNAAGPVGDALSWMDHYLRGVANGIDTARPISVTDTATGVTTGYASWPGKGTSLLDPLSAPATLTSDPSEVTIGAASASNWTRAIQWGLNTPAETSYEQSDLTDPYRVPTVAASAFSDYFSFVWNGADLVAPQSLVGSPTLRLTVAANQSSVSMTAYLYDVDAAGTASFMTVAPMTQTALTADTNKTITLSFQPIAWTLATGHHLSLVVDSADHRWSSSNVTKTTLVITSTTDRPCQLILPTP